MREKIYSHQSRFKRKHVRELRHVDILGHREIKKWRSTWIKRKAHEVIPPMPLAHLSTSLPYTTEPKVSQMTEPRVRALRCVDCGVVPPSLSPWTLSPLYLTLPYFTLLFTYFLLEFTFHFSLFLLSAPELRCCQASIGP